MPATGRNNLILWTACRAVLCVAVSVATLVAADPPADVVEFFRTAAQSLSEAHTHSGLLPNDPAAFLGHFDSNMPGYAELRAEIEDLVSRGTVGNAVEFVSDEGGDNKRTLDLDWSLEIENQRPRRAILKCTIERLGRKPTWKITSLEPVTFFKY